MVRQTISAYILFLSPIILEDFYSTHKLIWAIHFDWSNSLRGVVLHNWHREYAHINLLELMEYLHCRGILVLLRLDIALKQGKNNIKKKQGRSGRTSRRAGGEPVKENHIQRRSPWPPLLAGSALPVQPGTNGEALTDWLCHAYLYLLLNFAIYQHIKSS
jgi:hypothetical protein